MNIKIYGADWCSDCIVVKQFLDSRSIKYEYIIITNNNEAVDFLESVNKGKRIIPTLIIDDKVYANPGISNLMKILK